MASRFLIPVTRFYANPSEVLHGFFSDLGEKFPANTMVIPIYIDPRGDQDGLVIRRLDRTVNRRRVSTARPMYRIVQEYPSVTEDVPASPLELVPVGRRVLVEVQARRRQLVQTDERGVNHILLAPTEPRCREVLLTHRNPFVVGAPTCEGCLADETFWDVFYVQPYTSRAEAKKKATKEERERREYERRPSAFERLIDESFDLDAPVPTVVPFAPDPESFDETEDYLDGREGKLAQAWQSQARFETQKQVIQTELKTARKSRKQPSRP